MKVQRRTHHAYRSPLAVISGRIISAIEKGCDEFPNIGMRRFHAQNNTRKALLSTPVDEIDCLLQLDVENWESVIMGNTGFGEWASRVARYGFNAYQ